VEIDNAKKVAAALACDSAKDRSSAACEALTYLRRLEPEVLPAFWAVLSEGMAEDNIRTERRGVVAACLETLNRMVALGVDSITDEDLLALAWVVRDSSPPDADVMREAVEIVFRAINSRIPMRELIARMMETDSSSAGQTVQ